jgi:predicted HTH domain antitoxin
MKRLSSGMAAQLIGMDRLSFLAELPRLGVCVIDLDDDELASDVEHA